jgi:hypothetical protein
MDLNTPQAAARTFRASEAVPRFAINRVLTRPICASPLPTATTGSVVRSALREVERAAARDSCGVLAPARSKSHFPLARLFYSAVTNADFCGKKLGCPSVAAVGIQVLGRIGLPDGSRTAAA